jgi:hypothetical protein
MTGNHRKPILTGFFLANALVNDFKAGKSAKAPSFT